MLKRSILLVVVLIAILLIANPMNAEKNEIVFAYNKKNEEHTIIWGSSITQFKDYSIGTIERKSSFKKSSLPLLSNSNNVTSEIVCFSARSKTSNIRFCDIDISDIELFYYAPYNEYGALDMSITQFCLVKMNIGNEFDEKSFNKLINDLSYHFGKAKKQETSISSYGGASVQIGNKIIASIEYNSRYEYTWKGTSTTSMHLLANYSKKEKIYGDIIVYLEKESIFTSDKGSKKIVGDSSLSQIVVEKKRIALRDENKKSIQTLEVGTVLEIIGYNKDLNMFSAIVVDGNSKATNGSFDGYVSGDNLSVSREELLKQFKE